MLSNFKTFYKATIIKTVQCQHKDHQIYQWNRMDNSEILSHMIFDKRANSIEKGILKKQCQVNNNNNNNKIIMPEQLDIDMGENEP